MDNEQPQAQAVRSNKPLAQLLRTPPVPESLTQVTPLSKAVALGLFVLLPFIGFTLGVLYAGTLYQHPGPVLHAPLAPTEDERSSSGDVAQKGEAHELKEGECPVFALGTTSPSLKVHACMEGGYFSPVFSVYSTDEEVFIGGPDVPVTKVTGADSKTFARLESLRTDGYSRYYYDNDTVWALDRIEPLLRELPEAEPGSMVKQSPAMVDAGYVTDNMRVYHGSALLSGADAKNFRLIQVQGSTVVDPFVPDPDSTAPSPSGEVLGYDGTRVYAHGTYLEGVTLEGITENDPPGVIRDADTAWYLVGKCDATKYVPESEVDVATYRAPC